MGLTRITLLLAEIMLTASFTGWQAECPTPAGGCLAALAGGGHCSPCRVTAGNQLNLLNLSDSTAHTLGVNRRGYVWSSIC